MSESAPSHRAGHAISVDPHVSVVSAFAEAIAGRAARRVIRDLRRMDKPLHSGEDSDLRNAWEEVCVQVQFERSIFWDAYEDALGDLVRRALRAARRREIEAIWLQTPEGEAWWLDEANWGQTLIPCVEDQVVAYVRNEVLRIASSWSNPRIRVHLERAMRSD